MPTSQRLLWGAVSGLVLILVKIIGPDEYEVKAFIAGAAEVPDIISYFVFAGLTLALAVFSGAICNETDRVKLLIFCASIPAVVATATGTKGRIPEDVKSRTVAMEQPARLGELRWSFISEAHAQEAGSETECDEGSFIGRVARSTANRITGTNPIELPDFSVVVNSFVDLDQAKEAAGDIAKTFPEFRPSVGCRRPGNPYYPVVIGERTTRSQAFEWLGRYVATANPPVDPFISAYPFREPIYTPPSPQ